MKKYKLFGMLFCLTAFSSFATDKDKGLGMTNSLPGTVRRGEWLRFDPRPVNLFRENTKIIPSRLMGMGARPETYALPTLRYDLRSKVSTTGCWSGNMWNRMGLDTFDMNRNLEVEEKVFTWNFLPARLRHFRAGWTIRSEYSTGSRNFRDSYFTGVYISRSLR